MKKVWLVVALVALGGLAVNSFADVQNIRLSGDIRIRGYYLANIDENNAGDGNTTSAAFISQRTRVTVEADLEDHVLVVVTLKAEGLWGTDNETAQSAGAGTSDGSSAINRRWDMGVSEAYVQLNELFYTPATLKVGRQYLHYGHGLILSSAEQEYNYDAGRLVLDYYPLTLDVVGARLADFGSFDADHSRPSADLLFANARYEMSDSFLKDIEAYVGWVAQAQGGVAIQRIPASSSATESPIIIGLRSDINLTENFTTWIEGAYELGQDGTADHNHISAWIANAGARFSLRDTAWTPVLSANYIFASGGGRNGRNQFRPWFDYTEGYNGYLFGPALSNIHVFNVGASVKPYENTTLALQAYYYMKADADSPAGGNENVDFGGIEWAEFGSTPAQSRDLGWEFDAILGYDYSKDVRATLVYGMFIPEGAYHNDPGVSQVAHEVRAELNVKF